MLFMAIVGADFGSLWALPMGHIIILAFPSYVLFIFHNVFHCPLNQYRTPILPLWAFLNLKTVREAKSILKSGHMFLYLNLLCQWVSNFYNEFIVTTGNAHNAWLTAQHALPTFNLCSAMFHYETRYDSHPSIMGLAQCGCTQLIVPMGIQLLKYIYGRETHDVMWCICIHDKWNWLWSNARIVTCTSFSRTSLLYQQIGIVLATFANMWLQMLSSLIMTHWFLLSCFTQIFKFY